VDAQPLGDALRTLKLRPPLSAYALISLFAALGCVNRGAHQTIGGGGAAGTASGGAGGAGGAGGQMMTDGSQDQVVADGGIDAVDNCDIDGGADAGDAGAPSACSAMYNFESPAGCGLYGATLADNLDNPVQTAAFSNLRHSTVADCGRGSMAVDVDFNPTDRLGGGIVVPISRGGTASFVGKTLSISMMGTADGGSARFYVYLIANGTFQPVLTTQIKPSWQRFSVPLPLPDAGTASADNVMSISLEAFGYGVTYTGTIYIDELDVKNTTTDGGAGDGPSSDGPVDMAPSDARDGGFADVRDAPAGS
jgi:hypothetical protein